MDRACSTHETCEKFVQNLFGNPEELRLLGRPRRRWEDNIILDLEEIGWEVIYWIHLA
jgi:hypothetical protein